MVKLRSSLIFLLALALGACTAGALSAPKSKPPSSAPTPTPELVVEGSDKGDDFVMPVYSHPRAPKWSSFRSDIGGVPVPQGWKLVERKADGYALDETYEAPKSVKFDDVLAWYLLRFPSNRTWGDWEWCVGLDGNGDAGWYEDVREWWAWRSPRNTDHLIQVFLGGSPFEGNVSINLSRSESGSACHTK